MALTPIGMVRKIGKFIRGGVTPLQVFLGSLLGVLIGMTPGFTFTLLILIALVIVLNANGGMVAVGLILGKALCYLLAPVTFQIGWFAIHNMGFSGLFRAAGDTPVVALMGLHYYCVTGGILLGAVLGVALGVAAGNLINGLRKGLAAAGGRSELMQKIGKNIVVRVLLRIVFGKQKSAISDMLGLKSPILRKSGLIICVVFALLFVGMQFLLVDPYFKGRLRSELEWAFGAEVNIERADLSLFGGSMEIHGLQVTDPERPTHNLVQISQLSGDVSFTGLLTGRLIIDELAIDGAKTDSQREKPGEVFERPPPPEPPAEEGTLSEYFEKAEKYREYFQKLKEYLEQRDANEPEPTPEDIEDEKQRLRELAKAQGYFRLSAKGLLSEHPTWVIRKLDVQGLQIENVSGPLRVLGKQLSDAPQLHDLPMELLVTETEKTLLDLRLDYSRPAGEHHLTLHSPPLPLDEAFQLSNSSGMNLSGGTAKLDIDDGVFTNSQFAKFPFSLALKDLKINSREGKGVLGLDAETSREALKHLSQINIAGLLTGRLATPRLKLDEKALLSAFKDTLVAAGKAELARRADEQIGKLTDQLTEKVGGQLGGTIKDATGGLLDGVLPGLGGKKDPNEPKKEGGGLLDGVLPGLGGKKDPNEPKKEGGGLLDGLLR